MHPEFHDMYVQAREAQAHHFVAECVTLADECEPGGEAKVRLQQQARQWSAARLAPRIYGDAAKLEISGPDGGPIRTFAELAKHAREG